VMITR